jgi:hypothetical protein
VEYRKQQTEIKVDRKIKNVESRHKTRDTWRAGTRPETCGEQAQDQRHVESRHKTRDMWRAAQDQRHVESRHKTRDMWRAGTRPETYGEQAQDQRHVLSTDCAEVQWQALGWESSVIKLTSYKLNERGVWGSIPCRRKVSYILHSFQTTYGAQPASYLMRSSAYCLGIKRLMHETYHSRPRNVEFKNVWSYYLRSVICVHGVDLN